VGLAGVPGPTGGNPRCHADAVVFRTTTFGARRYNYDALIYMYDGTVHHALLAYKFTGKERDSESGLDNFGARYDSSSMGRFMSPDPIGGHEEDPQTLNRYAYVRNNPLNLTDPTGLDFYLQCTDEKHSGCTQVQIDPNNKNKTWVQADKDGNATIITSDSIRAGDNSATVSENGVTINGNSQGIYFDNPASHTTDDLNNNPIDLAGSGALRDFSFTINGNCSGSCLSSGSWSFPGSLEDARATLYGRGSFSFPGEDEKADLGYGDHPYATQHRFGASTCPFFSCRNSPHISVPNSWVPVPKDTVPQGFHVDAHGSFIGHQQDVQRKGVE
jgi:RHS repeat-associated protein